MKLITTLAFLFVSFSLANSNYDDICLMEEKKIPTKSLLVDVRTKKEYTFQHAKGSINIPIYIEKDGDRVLNKNFIEQINSITEDDLDKSLVIICKSGIRSKTASEMLSDEGYETIYNIKKGFDNGWRKANLPIEKSI